MKRKLLYFLLTGILTITNINIGIINVHAASDQEERIKDSMAITSKLIEEAINTSYLEAEDYIKKEIIKNKYDYYLTMESYHQQKNPYVNADYNELVVAYIIAKEYAITEGMYTLPYITAEITPQKTEDGTYYGNIKISGITKDDIFKQYNISNLSEATEKYDKLLKEVNTYVNGIGLSQETFLTLTKDIDSDTQALVEQLLMQELTEEQKKIITTAISLIGKVPYQWGGKPQKSGYDTSWFTINEEGFQRGLDCSGYIQWVYMTGGMNMDITNSIYSTTAISSTLEMITIENLSPGDIGLLHIGGDTINHAGMYLGNGYWIHCSSNNNTVSIEKTEMFKYFFKTPYDQVNLLQENVEEKNIPLMEKEFPENSYSEEEIYLLAQLIYNEANTEGLNGWIAVAEVVKNRIASEKFPDTITEVIYQKSQFSHSERIKTRKPSDEQITVARQVMMGNLTIFNNENVLFFRNAGGSTQDWGKYKYFKTINNHQFYRLIP